MYYLEISLPTFPLSHCSKALPKYKSETEISPNKCLSSLCDATLKLDVLVLEQEECMYQIVSNLAHIHGVFEETFNGNI